jgi:UDP-glucose 4-epimerase
VKTKLDIDEYVLQGASAAYNLSNGFSAQQVIDTAARVTGRPIPVADAPRREGDPTRLVAEGAAARKALGLTPF